jgi:hypothetical protein
MITPRHLAGAALLLAWALLLSARCIAAAVYATRPSATYEMALVHIGWVLPASAWISMVSGLVLLLASRERAVSAAASPAVTHGASPAVAT